MDSEEAPNAPGRKAFLNRGLAVLDDFRRRRVRAGADSHIDDQRKHEHGIRVREARRSRSADSFVARSPERVPSDPLRDANDENPGKVIRQLQAEVVALRQQLGRGGASVPPHGPGLAAGTSEFPYRQSEDDELSAAREQIKRVTAIAEQYLETGRAWQAYATNQRELAEQLQEANEELGRSVEQYEEQNQHLQRELSEAGRMKSVAEQRCAELEGQWRDLQRSLREEQQGRAQLERRLQAAVSRGDAEGKDIATANAQQHKIETECVELRGENERLDRQCKKLRQEMKELGQRTLEESQQLMAGRDAAEAELQRQVERVAELQQVAEDAQRELCRLREGSDRSLREQSAELEKLRGRLNEREAVGAATANAQQHKIETECAELRGDNERLDRQCKKLRQEMKELGQRTLEESQQLMAGRDAAEAELQRQVERAARQEQHHQEDRAAQMATIDRLTEELRLGRKEVVQAQRQKQELERRWESLQSARRDADRSQSRELAEPLQHTMDPFSNAEGRMEDLEQHIEILKAEKLALATALESKSSLLHEVDDSLMSDEASHQLLREQLLTQASRLETMEKQSAELHHRNEQLSKEHAALMTELIDVQSRCEAKDATIRRLEGDALALRSQLSDTKQEAAKHMSLHSERECDIEDCQRSNASLTAAVAAHRTELKTLGSAFAELHCTHTVTANYLAACGEALLSHFAFPIARFARRSLARAAEARIQRESRIQQLEGEVMLCRASQEKDQLRIEETAAVRDQLLDLLTELSSAFEGLRATKNLQLVGLEEECHRHSVQERSASEMVDLFAVLSEVINTDLEASHLRVENFSSRVSQLQLHVNELHDQHHNAVTSIERRVKELTSQRDRLTAENKELRENLEGVLREEERSRGEFEKTILLLQQELNQSREAASRTSRDTAGTVQDLQAKLASARTEVSRLQAEVMDRTEQIREQEEAKQSAEERLTAAAADANSAAENLSHQLAAAQDRVAQLQSELTARQQQEQLTAIHEEELQMALRGQKARLAEADAKIRDLEKELTAVRKSSETFRSREIEAVKANQELDEARRQLNSALATCRTETRHREEIAAKLEQVTATAKSLRTSQQALEERCQAAEEKSDAQARLLAHKSTELETAAMQWRAEETKLRQTIEANAAALSAARKECNAKLQESENRQEGLLLTISRLEDQVRNQQRQLEDLRTLQSETYDTARTAELSLMDANEKLSLAENRIRELSTRGAETSRSFERELVDVTSKLADEKKLEVQAIERMLQSERVNAADAREAQKYALRFVSQLQKENKALSEKATKLTHEVTTMERELHERKRESAVLASLAEDCSAQLGTNVVLSPVDLLHELMNRVTLQLSSAEHTFLEQIQFDELVGILERHSAVSSSIGMMVHRVFGSLRRAHEVLQRTKPKREDAAAAKFYRSRKTSLAQLEQQNITADRCVRSAGEFNMMMRTQVDRLRQHLHAIGTALSSPVRPTARVMDSIYQHKAYIAAKIQVLLARSAQQLQVLKELRDSYSRFEDDFSRTGCGGIFQPSGAVGPVQPARAPEVPLLLDSIETKLSIFAEGEEFMKHPFVISLDEFNAEALRNAAGEAGQDLGERYSSRTTGSHGPSSSRRDADDDEALRFVEQLPEDDAEDSEEEDELRHAGPSETPASPHDYRCKYIKVQKEKMRLYRLVRSLTKRLKSENQRVQQLSQNSPLRAVGGDPEVGSPEPSAIAGLGNSRDVSPLEVANNSAGSPGDVIWVPQHFFPEATESITPETDD